VRKIVESILSSYKIIGQNLDEISDFVDILSKRNPNNFLEIGTQYGSTFDIFCSFCSGKAISLDLVNGSHGGIYQDEVIKRNISIIDKYKQKDIHFINADSHKHETVQDVESILNSEKLDLLFIDGDHSFSGVAQDYEMYKHLVSKGGIIAFHDINKIEEIPECEVHLFWESFIHPNKNEINHKQSWIKRIKVIGGIGYIIVE
jgi:cephalosporin hydroxylase